MRFIDITGKKFGRLTALYRLHNVNCKTKWLCICECGNLKEITTNSLQGGKTKSCGCYRKEITTKHGKENSKHGKYKTRLYDLWAHMKYRCNNKNYHHYRDYGARGIRVCSEWSNDFQAFYDWAINNGYKENLSIDRINVNGNYEPSNCRWVDMKTQQRNRRNTRYIVYKGETRCLNEWCEILNLNRNTVYDRIYRLHWPIEKAFELRKDRDA